MKRLILIVMILILMISYSAQGAYVSYTSMGVPSHNSSFKSYMDAKALNRNSTQYKFIKNNGYIDSYGFYRCKADTAFGVPDDYYIVAMGSYYTRTVGEKFRITTDLGNVFYVVIGDFKSNAHTDWKHQYTLRNGCVVECIVNTNTLIPLVRRMGTCNVHMPLNGSVAKVEKMTFNY